MKIIPNIVEMVNDELRVSHRVIADSTNNDQISVRKLIDKHKEKLELFGRLSFEMTVEKRNNQGGLKPITYFLSEPQATLLLTFMRNNEIVISFKVRLVDEFFKMKRVLKKSKKSDLQQFEERAKVLKISKDMFLDFQVVFHEIGITRPEELAITSNRAVQKETGIDFIELAEKKGVSTTEKFYTVTELCQKVISSDKFSGEAKKLVSTKAGDKPRPQNLNKILSEKGYQTKVDAEWRSTEKG